jgi:hypothetical protein
MCPITKAINPQTKIPHWPAPQLFKSVGFQGGGFQCKKQGGTKRADGKSRMHSRQPGRVITRPMLIRISPKLRAYESKNSFAYLTD